MSSIFLSYFIFVYACVLCCACMYVYKCEVTLLVYACASPKLMSGVFLILHIMEYWAGQGLSLKHIAGRAIFPAPGV